MKKILSATLLALCTLYPGTAAAATEQTTPTPKPVTLRFALGDPEHSDMGVVGSTFKKYVEEKSNNTLKVELYYNGLLGDETETIHNVRSGTLDFTLVGIANVTPFSKKLGVLSLPYLFENLDEVVAATQGKSAALLEAYANEGDVSVVMWMYSGFRHLSNSKHPVTQLSDLKDLTIRVPQSAMLLAVYRAWGASPIPIPWVETVPSLQDGAVDGQCYSYIGFRAMNLLEARQKYLTELHYTYQLQPLLTSNKALAKLTPEQQTIIRDAGQEAQKAVLEYHKKETATAKEELVAKGLQVVTLEDESVWQQKAIEVVWPRMAEFVGGKQAINAFLKACGKQEWVPAEASK